MFRKYRNTPQRTSGHYFRKVHFSAGQKIRRLRAIKDIAQEDLDKVLGFAEGRTYSYEKERAKPSGAYLDAISKWASVPTAWFLDGQDSLPPLGSSAPVIQPELSGPYGLKAMPMVKIPVVGSVSAGAGTGDHGDEDAIEVPQVMFRPGLTGWTAEGDSMLPWIKPGDVVLVREQKRERLNYGFLVRMPDGQVRVKILAYDQEEGWVYRSVNRDRYPDEPAKGELIGLVTGIYRVDGTEHVMRSDDQGLKYKGDS